MDWISDLVIKRLAQRTNVFLLESFDMKRLQQIKSWDVNKLNEMFKARYDNFVDFDIQRGELTNLATKTKLALDPMASPLRELDNFLTSTRTVALIHYVFMQQHADMLTDYVAAWSQDDRLYVNRSTALIFVADATLFNESVRRLCYQITIEPSTKEERRVILENVATEIERDFADKGVKMKLKVTEDIIQASAGLDLHSVETAAIESFFIHRRFDVKTFTDYKIRILRTYNLEYVQPQIDFDMVGGYKALKNYIRKRIILPLRNPEKASYYGVGLPKGIILYGYPGTGKTYFTEAMAKELGLAMVKLTPADLFRGIVGHSEARVRQITTLVESLAPVVVMIDEVDQIATPREQVLMTDSGVSRRITNMLLDWLGQRNRKSLLVGCTNFMPLDPAFIRAGRVDEICLVLPPDFEARKEILEVHTSKVRKVPIKDVDLAEIARQTFMWTGAELEKLVLDAARLAMESDSKYVSQDHFMEAMKGVEVNVAERKESIQRMIATMRKLENVNRTFLQEAVKEFTKAEKDESRIKGMLEALSL
ncbi:MAG: ATP-binding protein [Candidatus Bathyarchaeota archaeon]|nr:ATP-binding protein [Candidatus Bathyarchaeota archaeon]MDW8022344.1 ATP-binding protein [Nitrososphaerota archaeon]